MIRLSKSIIGKAEMQAVQAVMENGYMGMGPGVQAFEKEIKDAFEFGSYNSAKESLAILDNLQRAKLPISASPPSKIILTKSSILSMRRMVRIEEMRQGDN